MICSKDTKETENEKDEEGEKRRKNILMRQRERRNHLQEKSMKKTFKKKVHNKIVLKARGNIETKMRKHSNNITKERKKEIYRLPCQPIFLQIRRNH